MRYLFAALLSFLALAQPSGSFYLKDHDTVVFYGDSITDQRLYTVAAEAFVVTRFPQLQVRFVHSGWGGDRVSGGGGGNLETRLRRDVFAYRPTVMTVMLGMNDGRYRAFDEKIFNDYTGGFEKLVGLVRQELPDIRLTFIQPSPYDDVSRAPLFPGGYNSVLVRYGDYLKDLARRTPGASTADLNTEVVAMLRRSFASDPALAQKIIPDRVHPGWAGHWIMAAELLKAWQAPKVVTAVELDAAQLKVVSAANTTINGMREASGNYVWTQSDRALPLALPDREAATLLAVANSDFMDRLNVQWLRVSGLDPARKWSLAINGLPAGEFTAEELSGGMNLAKLDTPMIRQSAQVLALTVKRATVHQLRWRQLQVPFEKDGLPRMNSLLDQLDGLDADLAARQHATARPSATYYELTGSRAN
jgi:lysophospholipase L1-like esterase